MLEYRRVWLAGGWLLIALVVYFSLAPHPPEPLTFENSDKFEHAFAYAMLSLWLNQLYASVRARAVVIVTLVGLGVGLEFVQGWTGYRMFDVLDMQANSVGVLLGWFLALTPIGRSFACIESRLWRDKILRNWN